MGLKRLTTRVEITYPADDPRTFDQLTLDARTAALAADWSGGTGESLVLLRTSVDPDPEPTIPDESVPADQTGDTAS